LHVLAPGRTPSRRGNTVVRDTLLSTYLPYKTQLGRVSEPKLSVVQTLVSTKGCLASIRNHRRALAACADPSSFADVDIGGSTYFPQKSSGLPQCLSVIVGGIVMDCASTVSCLDKAVQLRPQNHVRRPTPVDGLNYFEVIENITYYRPAGTVAFQELTALLSRALSVCRKNGTRNLLIDVTGLTGFEVPNIVERYWFVVQLARDANGIVFAIVAPQRMIDPERFGTTVARNRGALADIFSSEADARNWLCSVGRASADEIRVSDQST
jgi:hypothetical protein